MAHTHGGGEGPDLVDGRRNLGQVLPDAGHAQLDLVADTLLRTFGWTRSRDAEEAQQQHPEAVGAGLRLSRHQETAF